MNYKNYLSFILKKIKTLDFKDLFEKLKTFQIEDLKNINYRRLFYDLRNSKYSKPSLGLISAGLLSILFLIPAITSVNNSFKKVKIYKFESADLKAKIQKLKSEIKKFDEISKIMNDVNSSFLKKEQSIFITRLLNEAANKSNVEIKYFAPILNADSSRLCKSSLSQRKSKQFKNRSRKNNFSNKGSITVEFYEVNFNSDYLDIIEFLKEIQLYNVIIIPHCLEVNSEQNNLIIKNKENPDNASVIIPLNESGLPIKSYKDINELNLIPNNGKVDTKIIFKIPYFSR